MMGDIDYFRLLNLFWEVNVEFDFTGNESKLYFYLAHVSNKLYWKNPFRQSLRQIQLGSGISLNSIKSAQKRLIDAGLISVKNGSSGNHLDIQNKTEYYLITVSKTDTDTDTHTDTQYDTQYDTHPDTINKLKHKHKQENNILPENFKLFSDVSSLFDPKFYNEKKWLKCYDELIRIDNYTEENILKIVKHFRADSFWAGNFQTILKLRTKNKEGIQWIDSFADKLKNVKSQNNGNKSGKQEPEIGDSDRYARAAGKKVY